MNDLPCIALAGRGKSREECLDNVRRKARQYFGVESDERLVLRNEEATVWVSDYSVYSDDGCMFELRCLVMLRDAQ